MCVYICVNLLKCINACVRVWPEVSHEHCLSMLKYSLCLWGARVNSVCAGARAHQCASRDHRRMSGTLLYHFSSFLQTGSLLDLELNAFNWLSQQPASLGNPRAFPCPPHQFWGNGMQVHAAISGFTRFIVTCGSLCGTGWPASKASEAPVSACPALGLQVYAPVPNFLCGCWGWQMQAPTLV